MRCQPTAPKCVPHGTGLKHLSCKTYSRWTGGPRRCLPHGKATETGNETSARQRFIFTFDPRMDMEGRGSGISDLLR
jgi:hypothetical protein